MTLYLRRRARFSAGFASPPPGQSGGGHNYVCDLTVGGPIDPGSGMVVNIKDVDAVLKTRVVSALHGKLLDRDVAAFRGRPPTPERLVRFLWEECAPALPPRASLARVTLYPESTFWTELSAVEEEGAKRGGSKPMLTMTRAYDFSASHRLHSRQMTDAENAEAFGKCNWANGHGHNYEVEVTVAGAPDPRTGQLLPAEMLDAIVDEEVLTPYDHKHLNYDTADFADLNPTSENLTKVIWGNLERRMASANMGGARLHKVTVRETARNFFEYYGE